MSVSYRHSGSTMSLHSPQPSLDPARATSRAGQLTEPATDAVHRLARYIERHCDKPIPLRALARESGTTPQSVQRRFKRVMGITPRQYAEACRLREMKARLQDGASISTAMYDTGFSSTSRLYERAPSQLGMTPATYRRGGKGVHIAYTVAPSPLGRLIVAATPRGICAVSVGDDDGVLRSKLGREFPAADIERDDALLQTWVRAIVEHLRGVQPHLDLPLDVRATAFQWRVWQALRAIPYGTTRSYSEVAREVGQPTAVRAVANACARNPVPLIVPCHRVIREDGSLGGYGLGLDRKKKLLERERRAAGD